MNWTGGNLQRHSKGAGAGSATRQRQKAFFAKARTTNRNKEMCQAFDDSLIQDSMSRPQRARKRSSGTRDLASLVQNPAPALQGRKSFIRARDGSSPAVQLISSDSPFNVTSPGDKSDDNQQDSIVLNDDIESSKRRLLAQTDWLGLRRTRPQYLRYSPSLDRDRIAKRRKSARPAAAFRTKTLTTRDEGMDMRHRGARGESQQPSEHIQVRIGSQAFDLYNTCHGSRNREQLGSASTATQAARFSRNKESSQHSVVLENLSDRHHEVQEGSAHGRAHSHNDRFLRSSDFQQPVTANAKLTDSTHPDASLANVSNAPTELQSCGSLSMFHDASVERFQMNAQNEQNPASSILRSSTAYAARANAAWQAFLGITTACEVDGTADEQSERTRSPATALDDIQPIIHIGLDYSAHTPQGLPSHANQTFRSDHEDQVCSPEKHEVEWLSMPSSTRRLLDDVEELVSRRRAGNEAKSSNDIWREFVFGDEASLSETGSDGTMEVHTLHSGRRTTMPGSVVALKSSSSVSAPLSMPHHGTVDEAEGDSEVSMQCLPETQPLFKSSDRCETGGCARGQS